MVKMYLRRKPLKYERKIEGGIFDVFTIANLRRLMKLGFIDEVNGPISTGKEADIFLAFLKNELRAVKIYRIETSSFRNILPYISGDPKFRLSKKKSELVYEWAKKEFRNLERAYSAGIKVPRPYKVLKNILVLDFVGTNREPAIPLSQYKKEEIDAPKKLCDTLLAYLHDLYWNAGLVHADFSEFNVLMKDDTEPYLIDFAQAVLIKQPNAQKFLEKDAENLSCLYKKFGFEKSKEEILEKILK